MCGNPHTRSQACVGEISQTKPFYFATFYYFLNCFWTLGDRIFWYVGTEFDFKFIVKLVVQVKLCVENRGLPCETSLPYGYPSVAASCLGSFVFANEKHPHSETMLPQRKVPAHSLLVIVVPLKFHYLGDNFHFIS